MNIEEIYNSVFNKEATLSTIETLVLKADDCSIYYFVDSENNIFYEQRLLQDTNPNSLFFYKAKLSELGLADSFNNNEVVNNLVRSTAGDAKGWMFYAPEDGRYFKEELTLKLKEEITDFDFVNIVLRKGCTVFYTANNDDITNAINLPKVNFPIHQTQLSLHFGKEQMAFSVAINPRINWLNGNLKVDYFEVGLLSSYPNEEIIETEVYVSANVSVFNSDAFLLASLDLENGTPKGLSIEIYPEIQIDVAGSFDKIGTLIGVTELNIPDELPTPNLKIDYLKGYIGFTNGLESLSGSLTCNIGKSDPNWSPINDKKLRKLFALNQLRMQFGWQKNKPISWQVEGGVTLPSFNVNVSYAHPAKIILAQLSPPNSSEENVKKFLNETLNVPKEASDIAADVLTAVQLSVYADLLYNEIEFKIQNAKEWNLIDDILTVSNLDFRVFLMKKEGSNSFAFNDAKLYLDLDLPFGPLKPKSNEREKVNFDLEASYDNSEKIWFFEAETNQPIAVGNLIAGLASKFGASHSEIPDEITDLELEDLYLSFEHSDENTKFNFSGNLKYKLSKNDHLNLFIKVEVFKENDSWFINFSTKIIFAGYQFSVDFGKDIYGNKTLLASFNSDEKINLRALISEIAPKEINELIPENLELKVKNIFVAYYKPKKDPNSTSEPKSSIAFGIELALEADINLNTIPGIGTLIGEQSIKVDSFAILGSNSDLDEAGIKAIDNQLTKLNIKGFSSNKTSQNKNKENNTNKFEKGIQLYSKIDIAGLIVNVDHKFGSQPEELNNNDPLVEEKINNTSDTIEKDDLDSNSATTKSAPTGPRENRMLSPVGTKIGPFFIESVGLTMKGEKFGLNFTGGVEMGPMVMELINFSILSPLDKFDPTLIDLDLDGLALGYDKPPLTVSGVLLKKEVPIHQIKKKNTQIYQNSLGFQGGISIGIKQVKITALGAYSNVKQYNDEKGEQFINSFHSFFLYGYLGAPIGGPPFFFVTGIALGVGFNRDLIIPPPEKFNTFPLTAAALSPPGEAISVDSMKEMMLSLDDYIPIKEGNFWFAAGLKFESFKFLSGFLMLTVEFGDELEIGVLGIIEAIMPAAPAETLVRISIGFSVRILPERGIVEARGSFLPTTFILHEDVKLEGCMGLLAVMKDQKGGEWNNAKAGSFILTIGGYAPNYKAKPYYPKVPALKLSWQVNNNLNINADAYMAITPAAVMFGGHFHGHFNYSKSIVSVAVDLKMGLDFILYWKPMRYIGNAYADFYLEGTIEVGVGFITVDKSLSMNASANIDIWGPDFSGKANLKLHFFVSFSVPVEFGNASKNTPLINWQEFKNSLLPSDNKIISLMLTDGIIQESEKNSEEKIPLVNPYSLRLLLDTQIPIKKINDKDVKPKIGNKYANIGIKPMGLSDKLFDSSLDIIINGESKIDSFQLKEVYKNVPRAIWEAKNEKYSDEELIENVVCGYEITAKRPELKDEIIISASSIIDIIQGKVEGKFKTDEISNEELKLNELDIEHLKQEFNLV